MAEEEWLTARDRALLYVRALSLSALEGLEYALEALRLAQADRNSNPHLSPTAQTIRRLRELVPERLPDAEDNPLRGPPP